MSQIFVIVPRSGRETEEDGSISLRSMDSKIVVIQKIEETIIILLVKRYPKCDYVWS